MNDEEKLIADIDSAELSAEMLASLPSPEMYPLMLVNLQSRLVEMESRLATVTARYDAVLNRLARLGVR